MARVLFAATLFITSGAPRARADGPAQAQQWLDASTVRAKQGHFIAIAQVLANGSDPGFRYDSFPGVERIIAPDGKVFTRAQGKPWMESADWGKTGAPADEKRAADLDALVELAHRPFQPVAPDPVEGAARWRQADPGGNTFDLTREKPSRSPAHPYPHFEFHENPDESAEIFLRLVDAFWRWNGATAHVYVFYFYPQGEKSPPVQPAPEDQLAEALEPAATKPVKVDAIIRSHGGLRIAGMIAGADFDLTVTAASASTRTIAIGGESWSSKDGGAHWTKENDVDRTFYNLVRPPRRDGSGAGWPLDWPYVASDNGADPATGEALRQFDIRMPYHTNLPEVSFWLAMKDGKPAALRRYQNKAARAGKISGPLYVEYANAPGARGLLPPPGNPDAVPAPSANSLLETAIKAMAGKTWRIELQAMHQSKTDKGDWGNPSPAETISGLIAGDEFDLTATSPEGIATRGIRSKGRTWNGGPVAGTWIEDKKTPPGQTMAHVLATRPLEADTARFYEIAGRETHAGETWLHIREAPCQQESPDDAPAEYWLLLDKDGSPIAIRRSQWTEGAGSILNGTPIRESDVENFTPAHEAEKIAPPAGAGDQ